MVNDIPSATALIDAILSLLSTLFILALVSKFFSFQRAILEELKKLRKAVADADAHRREEFEAATAE